MRIDHFARAPWNRALAVAVALAAGASAPPPVGAEEPSLATAISHESAEIWREDGTTARAPEPLESAYYATPSTGEALAEAAAHSCPTCNGGGAGGIGGYPYNRCGCSSYALFPWFTGPGNCDTWCVGPHWEVALDGLILARDSVDWNFVPPGAGFTQDLADGFDPAPGARLFVTGYNENRLGLQVGYEGVNDFQSTALYSNVAGDVRAIDYESNINSLEINFLRGDSPGWKPFAGVRYIEIDENFIDFTAVPKPIPPPVSGGTPPAAFVDTGQAFFLDNRMIGLQGGAFRDTWRLNRWISFEPFGNAGVYLNNMRRINAQRNVTTIITGDDLDTGGNEFSEVVTEVQTGTTQEFSEMAFAGEAGITGVLRLNRCMALRGGYQVLIVNGVGQGIDAFLAPGLDPSTVVYHGGHFGLEYVR